jgi:FAD:protein FMN transferase
VTTGSQARIGPQAMTGPQAMNGHEMRIVRHAERVMGTVVSFDVRPGAVDDVTARRGLRRACATLHRADAVFSTWKTDSPMSRLRRGEITAGQAPAEMVDVLERCAVARRVSGGWFDPWALPGGVDPTGLVKGWAAQRALADLRAAGMAAAMVNAGGDVVVYGQPEPGRPWRVGIRDPDDGSGCLCVVPLSKAGSLSEAVATSGTYERGAHVLDPHTGRPAVAVVSATVVGADLALADALATALVAAGERGLEYVERRRRYSAMIVADDGSVLTTTDFPGAA